MSTDNRPGATQVSALLSTATAMVDEEFKRSERLDAKSRNVVTVTAAFFAVVQAAVIGLFNGVLTPADGEESSFIVWLAIVGGCAALALVKAVYEAYGVWKLRDDPVIETKTLHDFLPFAREDNPAVGAKLVTAYAAVIDGRRANNLERSRALETASEFCALAIGLTVIELVLAFVAVGVA